jgi:hypothetical protein
MPRTRTPYLHPYRPLTLDLTYESAYDDYRVTWSGDHDVYIIRVKAVTAHAKSNGEVYFHCKYKTGGDDSRFLAQIWLLRNDGVRLESERLASHLWPHHNDTTECSEQIFVDFVYDHWEEIRANDWKLMLYIHEKREK